MTAPEALGPGSPLIAGVGVPSGEFHSLDDEFAPSDLFDLSNSPDALQSWDIQKPCLNPQNLARGSPPTDSPNGSYQDDSSDSASPSNRMVGPALPAAAAAAAAMDHDGDETMATWNHPVYALDADDHSLSFDRDANDAALLDVFYGLGEHADTSINHAFGFTTAAAGGPNGQPRPLINNMPSPEMPTIQTNSPRRTSPAQGRSHRRQLSLSPGRPLARHRSQGHPLTKTTLVQQCSMTLSTSAIDLAGSRTMSPMSAAMGTQHSSPAAGFVSSPSIGLVHEAPSGINGQAGWPSAANVASPPIKPDLMPSAAQLLGPTPHLPPQAPLSDPLPAVSDGCPYELDIRPLTDKSRVETQIPFKLVMPRLPPGVTKLHFPRHAVSKAKLQVNPPPELSADTLELHITVVCSTAMENPETRRRAMLRARTLPQRFLPAHGEENSPRNGGEIRICGGCIVRENKRAARKKNVKPGDLQLWTDHQLYRVVVFNCNEILEWNPVPGELDSDGRLITTAKAIDVPLRIACYCRHHSEKVGFNVIITLKDFMGQVVAQDMSCPIVITDDHKTHANSQASNGEAAAGRSTKGRRSRHPSMSAMTTPSSGRPTTTTTATPRAKSRSASPVKGEPASKKRKASGNAPRVPNELAMTKLEVTSPSGSQVARPQLSAAISPFSPNSTVLWPPVDQLFGPFVSSPPTPVTNEHGVFSTNHRSASMDNLTMAHLYSAPPSSHVSRVPSPNGLRSSVDAQAYFAPTSLSSGFNTLPRGGHPMRPPPVMHKIIPNEGPMIGGIEVTVLGQAFFQGLEVWFGDQKATTTTYWGDSSLVCLLPPSPIAGSVPVTFRHQGALDGQSMMAKEPPRFRYMDDCEDKLMRTALTVLGHKISGHVLDASTVARKILRDGNPAWPGDPSAGLNQASHEQHLESQLLNLLDLMDMDDSSNQSRLDLKKSTGHTMLHMACSLGYHRFVAALLARGADPDARDRGGFTPLHMAAMQKQAEIVRRLMLRGADPTIRSLSGLTAVDMAQSSSVMLAIRQSEGHARCLSGSAPQGRARSTSLLWESVSRSPTAEEARPVDGEVESPEYSSEDFDEDESSDQESDDGPDEDGRCNMGCHARASSDKEKEDMVGGGEAYAALDELASAKRQQTTFRDQVQQQLHQFQQSMALHFQNLAQMPQMPTFPGMPMLPDYQAYLQAAPLMRRMQQLMAGSGSRPDGQDEGGNSKIDSPWWDISSYMQNSAPAPPSYEDIFGRQEAADRKQESALRATAEAEADLKCVAVFDRTSPSAQGGPRTAAQEAEPSSVLKIGRKNAITKEQQEQFLLAHERRLKKLSNDRNLFFIWIPLLVGMVCALLYSYFPSLFRFTWTSVRALTHAGLACGSRMMGGIPERAVEA